MFKKASGKNWVEALADRIAPLAEAERRRREAAADAAWRKAHAAGMKRREANRAKAARQAMRAAKAKKPRKAYDVRRLELPGWVMLLARLDPGRWYAAGEIKALMPEYARGSVRAWLWQRCVPAGYLERAPNADHDANRALGRQLEGRWLYRITLAGQGVVLAAKERVSG
jgi:hypothetical protein